MKYKVRREGAKKVSSKTKAGLQMQENMGVKVSPASAHNLPLSFTDTALLSSPYLVSPFTVSPFPGALFPAQAPVYAPPSFPSFLSAGVPFLDLSIYRESRIKALIKERSRDMYRLIRKVCFDGKYHRIKCVNSGGREYCWDLAVKVQFFGKMQGITLYPRCERSGTRKRIVYKALVLVNPYELWEEDLVRRFWNLQERIEFLIAKILFHECVHVMIALGKALPAGNGNTEIYLEFREMLDITNSRTLLPERREVQHCLRDLADAGSGSTPEKRQEKTLALYEFLINEKYSIGKTDQAFGFPWSNEKIARDYARLAALKAGAERKRGKKAENGPGEKEVRRLRRALKKLYDGIEKQMWT